MAVSNVLRPLRSLLSITTLDACHCLTPTITYMDRHTAGWILLEDATELKHFLARFARVTDVSAASIATRLIPYYSSHGREIVKHIGSYRPARRQQLVAVVIQECSLWVACCRLSTPTAAEMDA